MSQSAAALNTDLADAFEAFNQLSSQLAESYQVLEARVAELNTELAAARSERLEQLEARERLAARLEALLQALPAGVVVLDAAGRVQEANAAGHNLLGEALVGRPWHEVIDDAFAPRADDGHDVSLADGRRVNISTCPLGSEPGQILLLKEVTETRELQDGLNQHERLAAMGEVAASLAHQIRTPLASALLYGSHLKRARLEETDRLRFADKLVARLGHLERLVNDMLVYARGGTPSGDEFGAGELLEEVVQVLEPQLRAAGTTLRTEDATDGACLQGNREMLLSALLNLATNALQAMGEGGRLEVLARCDEGRVDLVIRDDGPGIAPEQQAQIFEPFFTTRTEGTGLGLAVVAAIARAHRGEAWVDSQPGEGCTFGLRLPRPGARAAADTQEPARGLA